MELASSNCSVFLLNYHLALVIKYRRKVIDDKISDRLKEMFEYICPKYNITLEEWNHDLDHIHLLLEVLQIQIYQNLLMPIKLPAAGL